jgi:hypothetical protein
MNRIRVSIAGLSAIVLVAGFGFAALQDNTWITATGLYLLTILTLLGSTVGAVVKRGAQRAPWLGFAIFGWGYFLAAFGPFLSAEVKGGDIQRGAFATEVSPNLLTTRVFSYLYRLRNPENLYNATASVIVNEWDPKGPTTYQFWVVWQLREAYFQRVAHSFTALLLGIIGAIFATLIAPPDERPTR